MVLNILLNAVTLFSQDCSLKRARGSKNSQSLGSLQKVKLSIKFECRRIHDSVDLDILKIVLPARYWRVVIMMKDWGKSKRSVTI